MDLREVAECGLDQNLTLGRVPVEGVALHGTACSVARPSSIDWGDGRHPSTLMPGGTGTVFSCARADDGRKRREARRRAKCRACSTFESAKLGRARRHYSAPLPANLQGPQHVQHSTMKVVIAGGSGGFLGNARCRHVAYEVEPRRSARPDALTPCRPDRPSTSPAFASLA